MALDVGWVERYERACKHRMDPPRVHRDPPVTAPPLISRDRAVVKAHLLETFSELLEPLIDAAFSGELTARDAERRAWDAVLQIGRLLLTVLFAAICRCATEAALAATGRSVVDVKLRMDVDYWPTVVSTFGPVSFPWFAFRDPGGVQVPARALFPLHGRCCSSQLCLEWETALASDHPFRKAAQALGFFTHGAVDLEDTTVERHAVLAGSQIAREWQYRTPAEIREILLDRATRDTTTGRPLIYSSTDAHALRRYVDLTWRASWKMINGIRLWCIDRTTGETVHLGGEYTWGDCREVASRYVELQRSGHLPADGDYGDGVVAQIVLPTDGTDWIAQHILPLFPNAEIPLDPYHVVEQVADAAAKAFPRSKKKARRVVKRARRALGIRDKRPRTVNRKGPRRRLHLTRHVPFDGDATQLLDVLVPILETLSGRARQRWETLLEYVRGNQHRMAYGELRNRGLKIGSGAIESLHRIASQLRLKLSGARWTADVAQNVLNIRMLTLSGRWDEFWSQPDLAARIATAERRA